MNTPSELSSNLPATGKMTVVAVVVVGVAVVAIAVVAAFLLASADPHSDWIPVYQDILKTSFGALAVGGLGGLAKLILDRHRTLEAAEADQRRRNEAALADERKAREAADAELRDRRYRFISILVDVSHDIDTAKLHIRANRSVKSWTDMVNERIVPARSRLGDMSHELKNWTDAGLAVFDQTRSLHEDIQGMDDYIKSLLDEYGENKQALGELQLKAEQAAKDKDLDAREQLLNQIWARMSGLPLLGDFVDHGQKYGNYRSNYLAALLEMRKSLVPERLRKLAALANSAQGVTTPSPSDPR